MIPDSPMQDARLCHLRKSLEPAARPKIRNLADWVPLYQRSLQHFRQKPASPWQDESELFLDGVKELCTFNRL